MQWTVMVLGIALMAAMPSAHAIAQQSTPTTTSSQQAVLVGSDSLVGGEVRDGSGRDIGKVSRLMIDPADGRIASLVISTGGTMGVGSNTISVPWTAVKVGQDRGKVVVVANQTLEPTPKASDTPKASPTPAEPRKP
jgi:sporulation protein YlmC with PRC-barrel domain